VLALAGCGGGGGDGDSVELQRLVGPGFSFSVPAGWQVTRTSRSVAASPTKDGVESVSATVFQLARPFDPAKWEITVRELDRLAKQLADRLGGSLEQAKTVRVGGIRARQYGIAYEAKGRELGQRLVFLLRKRSEYQLLCRWQRPPADEILQGCESLASTFRPG
jgi:hypothetical protein